MFNTLHEKKSKYGAFSGLCLPVFRLNTEINEDLLRESLYSVQIQENTDQKKLRIWTLFSFLFTFSEVGGCVESKISKWCFTWHCKYRHAAPLKTNYLKEWIWTNLKNNLLETISSITQVSIFQLLNCRILCILIPVVQLIKLWHYCVFSAVLWLNWKMSA